MLLVPDFHRDMAQQPNRRVFVGGDALPTLPAFIVPQGPFRACVYPLEVFLSDVIPY